MNISGKTKIVGIFGYPIGHTLSPLMHNYVFSYLGLDYIYLPFTVKENELKNAVLSLRALNIVGVNVTVPHKEKVIKYLDEISDEVKKIGAVNTIKNESGKLKGYNTDKFGFVQSLLSAKVKLENKKIIVLGSGGASRAVCFGLLEYNVKEIIITDVIEEKARILKRHLKKFYPDKNIQAIRHEEEIVFKKVEEADILVNATPVGMSPNVNVSPLKKIPPGNSLVVYDLVYNPLKTKLLQMAREAKQTTISGIEMLIYQGKNAFEIWTNTSAPINIMRKGILVGRMNPTYPRGGSHLSERR